MRIALCLIVRNELRGCVAVIPRLPRGAFEEVYAIDGNSSDGTVAFLESAGIAVYRQPKPGLNAAYVHAVERTTCEALVTFFPQDKVPVGELHRFRPLLEAGYDLVIASRNAPGGRTEEDGRWLRPRKWGVRALAAFVALAWRREGYYVRDVLHGIKGFTVAGFRAMAPSDEGVSIDLEMVARAYRKRLPRTEFPVVESPREGGSTNFPILSTGVRLAAYLLRETRRRE